MIPRFFYFDLGNVLCTFCHERMCRQMAEVCRRPLQQVREVVLQSDLYQQFESGKIDERLFYDQLCQRLAASPDRQRLQQAASDIFAVSGPMASLVGSLAAQGHRLGVLSNTNPWHWRWCMDWEEMDVLPGPFEHYVLSYEATAMKPERAIYEIAVRQAGVAAEEIFFVDDRPENVKGARAAGLDAVQFVDLRQLAGDLEQRGVEYEAV